MPKQRFMYPAAIADSYDNWVWQGMVVATSAKRAKKILVERKKSMVGNGRHAAYVVGSLNGCRPKTAQVTGIYWSDMIPFKTFSKKSS